MKVTISRTEVGGYCGACLAADPTLAAPSKIASQPASADNREHTRSH
jgi:hypothetical protein